MTPEDYKRLHGKLNRYGEHYDPNVDTHLPPDLVKTKKGAIAKRQPYFRPRSAAYYKAQCSFRGLKTSGKIDELQQLLKMRDVSQDARVKEELNTVRAQVNAYQEAERRREAERWWADPGRTLEEKVLRDAFRAVEESLAKEDVLKTSCCVFRNCSADLEAAARRFGLAYEFVDLAPGSFLVNARQVVGQEGAVKAAAKRIRDEVEQQRREAEARRQAEISRQRAAAKARQEQMMSEAKQAADWDLTGSWVVECHELAEYSEGPDRPAKLSMQIWRDDFSLQDVREEEPHSSSEEEDEDEEEEERRDHKAPAPRPNDTHIPRFHASFNFGPVEGIMRIYPPSTPPQGPFKIKSHPTFVYVHRCRETGEGEIQLETDDYAPGEITFSDYGLSFKAKFKCPFIAVVLEIRGRKTAQGSGGVRSSLGPWTELGERAYEEERVGRW
ncbi:hypothetical protein PRZ48_011371 [Zasmidium cellare]|uniref:Uncharacterized protein n=1 Tax=Zasmidium cellare TaxID=395010 RepID=A0ABR0E660_ZASCE|nr:hypothetical protein PRZ48_011371 [Zasmidium cellare]